MNTNSFRTPPTDRLMLGDCLTQVTADTGSTVFVPQTGLMAIAARVLEQFSKRLGRQSVHLQRAFTQAQPLQRPVLLHLQQTICHLSRTCNSNLELWLIQVYRKTHEYAYV